MSEFINNSTRNKEKLKQIIMKLHEGVSVEEVQAEFNSLSQQVSASEITEMEQALVDEGMAIADIQKLCDVHANVFKGSIENVHQLDDARPEFQPGHPIHTFRLENRVMEQLIENEILKPLEVYVSTQSDADKNKVFNGLWKLRAIDKHYSRKENLLFPYMEKHDITAPPQVMWGVDDEIREELKSVLDLFGRDNTEVVTVEKAVLAIVTKINDMIFKEEEIMFPMVLEVFNEEEWITIEEASGEIGYTLLAAVYRWRPNKTNDETKVEKEDTETEDDNGNTIISKDSEALVKFDAGSLTAKEINAILNTLPLDMTFVDAKDQVKYFTQGKERIFDRPLTIIGREVKNCHPPKSVHIVEQIVADLKSGKKDNEDFWIKMGPNFVYIRYFAVRDKAGNFLGTLEITQNIKPIMALEGEKRLMSE